jgi:DNA repair exonuclease SbcCD nuclease subunit
MKRKIKMKQKRIPTCILSADWHIRSDTPLCRTDDYMEAQKKKIEFILNLAKEQQCPILVAGDFGDKPLWGDKLLNWFINIKNKFESSGLYTILGQHDLINHRIDQTEEGGIGVLYKNGCIEIIKDRIFHGFNLHTFPYSVNITLFEYEKKEQRTIALTHQMVIQSQKKKLWYNQKANHAKRLLKKFPCYDLIVSGDNHQSFSVEYEGRLLVNPGSIMRMTAAQINHKPRVALWYAESNEIEWVYLPIQDNVIDRSHIDESNKRDERIESFVDKLETDYDVGFSYEENLKRHFNTNPTKKRIKEKIMESMI